MDVRRPHRVRTCRVGRGLDRFEVISALGIRDLHSEPIEVRIERRGVRVAGMSVATPGVSLPDLDSYPGEWFGIDVENAAHDVDDLSLRAGRSAGKHDQVGDPGRWPIYGIEGSEDLIGSPLQRLGSHRLPRPGERERIRPEGHA